MFKTHNLTLLVYVWKNMHEAEKKAHTFKVLCFTEGHKTLFASEFMFIRTFNRPTWSASPTTGSVPLRENIETQICLLLTKD